MSGPSPKKSKNDCQWLDSLHHPFLLLSGDWCLLSQDNFELIAAISGGKQVHFYSEGKITGELDLSGVSLAVGMHADISSSSYIQVFIAKDRLYAVRERTLFHSMQLSPEDANGSELELYEKFKSSPVELVTALKELRNSLDLSLVSYEIIQHLSEYLDSEGQFAVDIDAELLSSPSFVNCACSIARFQGGDLKTELLIVGTETSRVKVVDVKSFQIVADFKASCPLSLVHACGFYDFSYCIFYVTRDDSLFALVNGVESLLTVFSAVPLFLLSYSDTAVVVCNNGYVQAFRKDGVCHFEFKLPSLPESVCKIDLRERAVTLWAVGCQDRNIYVYRDHNLVSTIPCEDVPASMHYGKFGNQAHSLAIIGQSGGLSVKTLKRAAIFTIGQDIKGKGPPSEQPPPIEVPPRSQIYLQEFKRQQENSKSIHETFQRDIQSLKQIVEQRYDNSIRTNLGSFPVDIGIEVIGLGPLFRLKIKVSHSDTEAAFSGFEILSFSHHATFNIPHFELPLLLPDIKYSFDLMARLESDKEEMDEVSMTMLILHNENIIQTRTVQLR